MSDRVRINDVSIYDTINDDDGGLHWDGNADIICHQAGGTNEGKILVVLDVDGQLTCVYGDLGQTGDLVALDRSIEALTSLRSNLSSLYEGSERDPGRCMAQDDCGRCSARHDHEGPHNFPLAAIAS